MGRRSHDAIAVGTQRLDRLGGRMVTMQIDPLIRTAHDIQVGIELATILDRMDILHTECLAVAHQSAGVLCVIGILHTYSHIAGAAVERAIKHLIALFGDEVAQIGNTLGIPFVRTTCRIEQPLTFDIFHLRPKFSDNFRSVRPQCDPP